MLQWRKPSALWAVMVVSCAAVLTLYGQPDFVVATANQVWFCFQ